MRIGVIADVQYSDMDPLAGDEPGPRRTKYYRGAASKLAAALQDLAARGCTCTVSLGDCINGHSSPERDREELELVAKVWRQVHQHTSEAIAPN